MSDSIRLYVVALKSEVEGHPVFDAMSAHVSDEAAREYVDAQLSPLRQCLTVHSVPLDADDSEMDYLNKAITESLERAAQ